MHATKEKVIADALELSDQDREDVLARLIESLDGQPELGVAEKWDREITRRLDDIAAGQAVFSPWAEARKRILGERNGSAG